MRTALIFFSLAAVFVICVNAVFPENFEECALCLDEPLVECIEMQMGYPCHSWYVEEEWEIDDRGDDAHAYYEEGHYVGTRPCYEEHDACSGRGLLVASLDLRAIVDRGDREIVEWLADSGVWIEVNRARSAVQFLSTCSEEEPEQVIVHISVSQDLLEYWSSDG